MDEDYFMMRSHVPAFGSWDSGEYLPFTECFESATRGGFLCYTYQDDEDEEEDDEGVDSVDLYVAGDLYQNDVVTPAIIAVPRSNSKSMRRSGTKRSGWQSGDQTKPHQPKVVPNKPSLIQFAKPVDEDLYKISPDVLSNHVKKKRGLGFLASCCFVPSCFA